MIVIKINVTRIDKDRLFKGAKGTYLDAVLLENHSDYGDDGFIVQCIPQVERDKGARGPILGSWRTKVSNSTAPDSKHDVKNDSVSKPEEDSDGIPF